jgi:hypothetical protein
VSEVISPVLAEYAKVVTLWASPFPGSGKVNWVRCPPASWPSVTVRPAKSLMLESSPFV